ncbi:MAG TPA: tetratricopeptide repeat protein [Patescibacteria group bacterium]|nr:tetratricopeptide repeat protein [Patescibacteria group bacterium]
MQENLDTRAKGFAFARQIIAAVAILAFAAGCSHKSVDSYLQQGDQAMQASRLADAESNYEDAIKLAPNDPRPHVALGNLYMFEQKSGPAEIEFMKVLELDPHNAPGHFALGGLYASQSESGLAEGQYRAAVVLDPTRSAYRLSLGTVLQKEGKLGEAEAEFRTATGLDPKNAHAHLALANLLNTLPNRQADAQAEYAQVKALDPSLVPGVATAPAAVPTTTTETTPPPPAGPPKIKATNRKFRLTHDSPLYQMNNTTSPVVGQVHRGKFVHVTGIAGDWLQVKLKNGTVGFIPVTAAE